MSIWHYLNVAVHLLAPRLRARRGAAWLARIDAGVGLVLVFAAVRLARGG